MKQLVLISFLASSLLINAQEKISLDGYLNDMQTLYHVKDLGYLWENQLHNRLNLNIYPNDWLVLSIQARNRLIQGNTYSKFPGYGELLGEDGGWVDLNFSYHNKYNENSGYVLSSMIDRAYAEITLGDFVASLGRQRINWGQTFVWNPNDIFNSYSYFDVDYPERPGSDALRLQYYTGMTSNLEAAAKIDSAGNITAAGYFRFSTHGYDIQLIGGVLSQEDLVLGTGWSGYLGSASFRGEVSYFRDLENFRDSSGKLLASIGLDYTFTSSLWLQAELLYSGFAKNMDIYNFMQIFASDMNVKRIGFTPWSIFGSIAYPISPLLNISLAGMYYPEWKGFYLGPSFEYSLAENLGISLIFQEFSAEMEDPFGNTDRQNTFIGYARIKWSF